MAKIDRTLRKVFAWAVLVSIVAVFIVVIAHFQSQYRQAQREVIYRKALMQVKKDREARKNEYLRRLERERAEKAFQDSALLVKQEP
ncbi:hypothetical protein [Candidatus Avelusimicrobium sp.]